MLENGVLHRAQEKRKANRIGGNLLRSCLVKHVIEGNIVGGKEGSDEKTIKKK
jgi:hypothetical protein